MFLGIDLTSSESRASACALLDDRGSLADLTSLSKVSDILAFARERSPSIVAIDAPLGFPKGMCCLEEACGCSSVWPFKGRVCERELARRGIPLYFTTKRSIIKTMVYRAMRLSEKLATHGVRVLEVYPYAAKVALFGKPIPRKTTREGIAFLRGRLRGLVPGVARYDGVLSHDLCDALVAAHTAFLHDRGDTVAVGLREEACIVVPDCGSRRQRT